MVTFRPYELDMKKEVAKKRAHIKLELKRNIIKILLHNKACKPYVRIFLIKNLTNTKRLGSVSFQKNICINARKYRSVYKRYNLKRHSVKIMSKSMLIQNTKIKSW